MPTRPYYAPMQPRRTNRLALLSGETYDNPSFEESLRHITERGTYNISVLGDDRSLGWSYSTGMYDTWGQPEIIMTGFPSGLAGSILDDVADLYKDGESIVPDQRTPGLIGNDIDVIFRPVTDVWVRRLMLRSLWFYGQDAAFPVLQCICPDFENRFPWEPGFDQRWRTRQALLQESVERTEAETKLWNVSSSEHAN